MKTIASKNRPRRARAAGQREDEKKSSPERVHRNVRSKRLKEIPKVEVTAFTAAPETGMYRPGLRGQIQVPQDEEQVLASLERARQIRTDGIKRAGLKLRGLLEEQNLSVEKEGPKMTVVIQEREPMNVIQRQRALDETIDLMRRINKALDFVEREHPERFDYYAEAINQALSNREKMSLFNLLGELQA